MRKTVLSAALAVAALPVAANAAFLVSYPTTQAVPAVASPGIGVNNFVVELANNGITRFASTGASVVMTTPGLVKFEYFAKEASFRPTFTVTGISYQVPLNTPVIVNNFAAPVDLGTVSLTPGTFNPTFSSVSSQGPVPGLFTIGSPFFGIGVGPDKPQSNGSYLTNEIWFLYDDNGVPDDNHDDMIIRATFAVPEPSTWAMMILGFGVIGLVTRRRTQQRVSFV